MAIRRALVRSNSYSGERGFALQAISLERLRLAQYAVPIPDMQVFEVLLRDGSKGTLGSDAPVRRCIPSFACLQPGKYGYRFIAECPNGSANERPTLVTLVQIGEAAVSLEDLSTIFRTHVKVAPEQDFFEVLPAGFRLYFVTRGFDPEAKGTDWLLFLSWIDNLTESERMASMSQVCTREIVLPPTSQWTAPEAIARRVCSAANLRMIIGQSGYDCVSLEAIARLTYCEEVDSYGVWPQSIYAASRFGHVGAVLALCNLEELATIIALEVPVVVTIAYEEGSLMGAAVCRTPGHLVTVVDIGSTHVVVMDPAASTESEVRRQYDIREFAQAWLERKGGVCYVFNRVSLVGGTNVA